MQNVLQGSARSEERGLYLNRDFVYLLAARSVSLLGDSWYSLAIVWWLYEKTGTSFALSKFHIANVVPRIVLGMFAGAYIDSVSRKKVLVGGNVLATAVMVVTGLLIASPGFSMWHLYVITASLSVLVTFMRPADLALIPQIVPGDKLTKATSSNRFTSDLVAVLAPAIGGWLYYAGSVQPIIWIIAVSFVGAALLISMIRPTPVAAAVTPMSRRLFQGINLIFWRPVRALCFLNIALNFFMSAMAVLLAPYAERHLGTGPLGFGLMITFITVGSLLGSLITGLRKSTERAGRIIVMCVIAAGTGYVLLSFVHHLWAALALLTIMGSVVTMAGVHIDATFLRRLPNEEQGAFFGTYSSLNSLLRPLSLALLGYGGDALGVSRVFLIGGAVIILIGLLATRSRSVLAETNVPGESTA
jgi:DHA3 family macrolide efflux protein-like MFS transporter